MATALPEMHLEAAPGDSVNASNEGRRIETRLRHLVGKAVVDYRMIESGDRIMVCMSGGKDSYSMLDFLLALRRRAPVPFELVAVNLDQKQPGFPEQVLPGYLASLGVAYDILEQDTYSVVVGTVAEGKTYCGLCSRLRRGALYRYASEHGITKIALGHHREDIVETFFLNLFHAGKVKAMPPKLLSDDGRHVVIRPMAYCAEADIAAYARMRQFPIIPCDLCGSQDKLERVRIKSMLRAWEDATPGRVEQIFRGLQRVRPSHLADRQLFDFEELSPRAAR
jgi:tRNA 2-thiocytidine biosynthesis protein TtcA